MNKIYLPLLISVFLITSFTVWANTNQSFPEIKKIENKDLVLNGVGVRKATFLKVKVYVGALYLEKKSSDASTFLNDDTVKYIEMHFVRDVDKKSMTDGWLEAFNNALNKNLAPHKEKIDKFLSYNEDMKDKDTMLITFTSKGVKIKLKDRELDFIEGNEFSKALFSIWFINAKDQGLRDGLLGLSK